MLSTFSSHAESENQEETPSKRDWIISLIHAMENQVEGATKLVKLLFLVDQTLTERKKQQTPFEFNPYKYGPYDKSIHSVLDELAEEQLISESTEQTLNGQMYIYQLNSTGQGKTAMKKLSKSQRKALEDVVNAWGDSYTDTLLTYVYEEYPEYAH